MRVVLFCGDREWTDAETIRETFDRVLPDRIIEGEARGADRMSRQEAVRRGVPFDAFPADWDQYGKAAGPIRNKQMLDALLAYQAAGAIVGAVAFHDNLLTSKGTKNMVGLLRDAGVPVEVIVSAAQPTETS